jgi:hypothetical protein
MGTWPLFVQIYNLCGSKYNNSSELKHSPTRLSGSSRASTLSKTDAREAVAEIKRAKLPEVEATGVQDGVGKLPSS